MKIPDPLKTPLMSIGGYRAWSTERGIFPDQWDRPYDGFNLCHYTGDSAAHIAACRRQLAGELGIDPGRLIIPRQTHSTEILTITDTLPTEGMLEDVDGLITTRHDIVIGVNTADCVPLILVDPRRGVAAAVHAGWRGAVAGIVDKALDGMEALGCATSDIHAAMGASICSGCFEVGPEVAERFPANCITTEGHHRPHVSLQCFIAGRLEARGVPKRQLTPFTSELCTRCHPHRYFSARRLGVASGRVFTFVAFGAGNKSYPDLE